MSDPINRTLIVGASGRVGSLLSRAWQLAGHTPILQHRGKGLPIDLPQIDWAPLSQPVPKGLDQFSAMIILAGAVPGRGDLALNARLADACLQAADQAGISRVILASSSAVYGANGGGASRENTPLYPVNAYGQSKIAAEAVADIWRGRGLRVTCLRIGNVAGADALLTNPARPLPLDQFSDAQGPVRSYIGPISMARALAVLLHLDLPKVLNFAAPLPISMASLASAAGIAWGWQAAPSTAQQHVTLNCAALTKMVPFRPEESRAPEMVRQWQAVRGER